MASLDPDYDLVIGTYTAIWQRYERAGLGGLTGAERSVFLAWQFVAEVNNGGFRQFLTNPSGGHARETPTALTDVGMPQAAFLLRQALDGLGHSELAALSDAFFGSPENPYEILASYVHRHRGDLPAPVGLGK